MDKRIIYTTAITVLFSVIMISCVDENVGEFTLTGDIEHLVPENSYHLTCTTTSNGKFIIFTPTLDSNFEYWGLALNKVEYYMDDTLYSIEQNLPCELVLIKDELSVGSHELLAKMTITGSSCNDLVIEKNIKFHISTLDRASEQHGDFYIDYNYVSKGERLVITPELLINRSSPGCEIDKVEYYWDGKLISTQSTTPFCLDYRVNNETDSKHTINATIHYHDTHSSDLTYNWTLSGYKVYAEDYCRVSWDIKSTRNDYVNGEILFLTAKLFKGDKIKDKNSFEIEFYLDDKLIGKSSTFPYTLEYKLTGLSVGTHTVTGRYFVKNNHTYYLSLHNNYWSFDNSKIIIITK